MQVAEVTLPRRELERIWTPEYLERLARTYWRYLTRISLGLLRVLYTPTSREVVLLARPLVLLRFRSPEYDTGANHGSVLWRIDSGGLVAPRGRGRGFLRVSVVRPGESRDGDPGHDVTARVSSEVVSFYPMIAALGARAPHRWLSRMGQAIYRATQLRIHTIITHGFLRSLARLDLAPSVVGALKPPGDEAADPTELTTGRSGGREA
jgi:hypothetical protein